MALHLFLVCSAFLWPLSLALYPSVVIDSGPVIGTTTLLPTATATVNQFLGIPFAKSPPERFSPPQSVPSNRTPINATAWKPACIQEFQYPPAAQEFAEIVFGGPVSPESEDCLYLNVYAPSTPAAGNGRTVMFWIYGGSLQFGKAGQPVYDGSAFAAYQDVIVVTTNYRTNVFGFPGSPELPLTGHNLGFLDQRFALDWVQRNIHAFGGDPEKVTVFGESAGAFSIDALLTSFPKDSSPPFRGAILESGQYSYRYEVSESNVPPWNSLSSELGCPGNYSSDLACVRAANATRIKTIIEDNMLTFNPVADGVTLVSHPAAQRLSGNIANIPVMGGTNSQEGRAFAYGINNLTAFLDSYFGTVPDLIPAIRAAYAPDSSEELNSAYDIASAILTDYIFQCPAALWANDTASIGIPVWRYYFNASFHNTQNAVFPGLGVYHSSEIPIVFSTYPTANTTVQEAALSAFMQGAWARFAKNPVGGPGWNGVGTGGVSNDVLVGAYGEQVGGIYYDQDAHLVGGTWDIGVLGNVRGISTSGVTVVDQAEVDQRCVVLKPVLEAIALGNVGVV